MAAKPRSQKKPTPPDRHEILAALDKVFAQRRQEYSAFADSKRDLPPLERAEAWLSFVAAHIESEGDQEALVYLRSRGHDCGAEIEKMIAEWRHWAEESIRQCSRGTPEFIAGSGKTKTRRIGGMSLREASQVRRLSRFQLRDFWTGSDYQEFTIDATMLRTVEWCDVGGFDDWWQRMAKEFAQDAALGGVEPVPASYALFALVRSRLAIDLMGRSLGRIFEALTVAQGDDEPWSVFAGAIPPHRRRPARVAHLELASCLAFAGAVLAPVFDAPEEIPRRAAEFLLSCQQPSGPWGTWFDLPRDSIETTAMAVHALAVAKPRGWQQAVRSAEAWLWSVQHVEGFWAEASAPDAVWLTVLVLDAIALARGEPQVTCLRASKSRPAQLSRPTSGCRFEVALSFPGEHRQAVSGVADALAETLGQEDVFYDEFHQEELARPNLDTYLQSIYRNESRLVVVFLCAEYEQKEWCSLEWRAIRDLIKTRRDESIMFCRLDDAEIPGVLGIDGYVDIQRKSAQQVAALILKRLAKLR